MKETREGERKKGRVPKEVLFLSLPGVDLVEKQQKGAPSE